jgi:hypothetical protein
MQRKGRERDPGLFSFVIPGRAKREPGIHFDACDADQWIPGLRLAAHPGMTRWIKPDLTPPLPSPSASDSRCSPSRRRRRTSPCPTRSAARPAFSRSARSGFEMNGLPNAIRSALHLPPAPSVRQREVVAVVGDVGACLKRLRRRGVVERCVVARAAGRAFDDVDVGQLQRIELVDDVVEQRLRIGCRIRRWPASPARCGCRCARRRPRWRPPVATSSIRLARGSRFGPP